MTIITVTDTIHLSHLLEMTKSTSTDLTKRTLCSVWKSDMNHVTPIRNELWCWKVLNNLRTIEFHGHRFSLTRHDKSGSATDKTAEETASRAHSTVTLSGALGSDPSSSSWSTPIGAYVLR